MQQIVLFILSCIILWFASNLVISGIEHFSKNTKVSTFATSVLILGILTSLTEISVGINSILDDSPTIYVGNLIGGSFVILMLVIPVLAIFSRGITLKQHLDQKRLLFFLTLIIAPSFTILDGRVTRYDSIFLILLYVLFFYIFQNSHSIFSNLIPRKLPKKQVARNLAKIVLGAVLIYIASVFLVDATLYMAKEIRISPLLVSLLILSLGTNLPEIVIAFNSIRKKHSEIAFGDYVGSAAANPLLFGIFSLIHGPFVFQTKGFDSTFLVIFAGYVLFFIFARSKSKISVYEGIALILVYIVFILLEASEIFALSSEI